MFVSSSPQLMSSVHHRPAASVCVKCPHMLLAANMSVFRFPEPPEFVLKLPATKFVKRGESLRLECKVSGTAPLKVTWYKHDTKVTDGANVRTSFVDSVAVLELLSSSFDDDGVYTCEAQNDAGSVSCSTTLSVKGQHLTDGHRSLFVV